MSDDPVDLTRPPETVHTCVYVYVCSSMFVRLCTWVRVNGCVYV